jgi:hypothetical protein
VIREAKVVVGFINNTYSMKDNQYLEKMLVLVRYDQLLSFLKTRNLDRRNWGKKLTHLEVLSF